MGNGEWKRPNARAIVSINCGGSKAEGLRYMAIFRVLSTLLVGELWRPREKDIALRK